MMRKAQGTGSQRKSSECTEGSPVRLAVVAAVAVIIAMPTLSAVQEPPETPTAAFHELPLLVNLGDRITVTDDTGRELQGELIDLSPSALSVLADDTRYDLQETDITGIRQRRPGSRKNGTQRRGNGATETSHPEQRCAAVCDIRGTSIRRTRATRHSENCRPGQTPGVAAAGGIREALPASPDSCIQR